MILDEFDQAFYRLLFREVKLHSGFADIEVAFFLPSTD